MDVEKWWRASRAMIKEGKLRRNAKRTTKMNSLYTQEMANQPAGVAYATGIGL